MQRARITDIRQETPAVRSFRLFLLGGEIAFAPGQWVDLYMAALSPDDDPVVGGFSITSSPLCRDAIELAVKRIPEGAASVHLHDHVQLGDVVAIDGGYGEFTYQSGMSDRVVLLAAGIGITPLMSIVRFVNESEPDVSVTLCYSARTVSELVFRQQLETIAARNARIHCTFTVTQPGQESWTGRRGRIDRAMLSGVVDQGELFYLCGPRGFVFDTELNLLALGVPSNRIRKETW